MRGKRLSTLIVALCLVLLLPNAALADNCGGLDDCYGTILAAILAILGIALFIALLPLLPEILAALDGVLTALGLIEAVTGRSVLTGEKLAWWERILGVTPTRAVAKIAGLGGKSVASFARSLQGSRRYPGVDRFRDGVIRKGTILYAGEPASSHFFTTKKTLAKANYDAPTLFEGLQVEPYLGRLYRPRAVAYEVLEDTPAAFGLVRANPAYGRGGYLQIVLERPEKSLKYVNSYMLRNSVRGKP